MVTCKVSDYITISLLPGEVECDIEGALDQLLRALYIEEWKEMFVYKCTTSRYESIARFGDVQLKIPYVDNFKKQGICLEFSGRGVDYFVEYLTINKKTTLRNAMSRFIALSKFGFETTASRFDVAFDEIIRQSDSNIAFLDLDCIKCYFMERKFVTKFRKGFPSHVSAEIKTAFNFDDVNDIDASVPYNEITSMNLSSGRIGKTIELGKRGSPSFIRFYDKLAEQEAHGYDVPADYKSWVRFEMEFRKDNAKSALVEYATSESDEAFAARMSSVAMGLIRFIELDHSRIYNCTTAEWWLGFLNNAQKGKLMHVKPKFNRYVRAFDSKMRNQSSTLASLVVCRPSNLKSILVEGLKHKSKSAEAIYADFKAIKFLSEDEYESVYKESTTPLTGYEFWKCFKSISDEEFEAFMDKVFSELCESVCAECGISNGV